MKITAGHFSERNDQAITLWEGKTSPAVGSISRAGECNAELAAGFPISELLSALVDGRPFCFDLILRVEIDGEDSEKQRIAVRHSGSWPSVVPETDCGKPKQRVASHYERGSLSQTFGKNSDRVTALARFGDVEVDFRNMELWRAGKRVHATAQEFKTLQYFISRPKAVISREELLTEVWGYDSYPTTRTVDNRIMKLRQKLEATPSEPVHFLTVHGAGYKFVP